MWALAILLCFFSVWLYAALRRAILRLAVLVLDIAIVLLRSAGRMSWSVAACLRWFKSRRPNSLHA